MKLKTSLIILTLIFIASLSKAQTVGSFEENITFEETDYNFNRTLYYYVPADYNPNNNYPLVIGFRGGPHSHAGQFRDQLSFLSDSIGAIVVCPENEGHFWNEEGLTKQLFQYSVARVAENYTIDLDQIYLTGLSYGGRHAVIVSMDTDNGPIPKLRGVIPFAAGSDSHLEPDYNDVSEFPPACICIGLNDNANFISVANSLHSDIQNQGGKSFLNEIGGVGHTVAFPSFPSEFMECINFIESTYSTSSIGKISNKYEDQILISPNPAQSRIDISYPDKLQAKSIFISDITGKKEMSIRSDQKSIEISHLPKGTKLLVIDLGETVITKKFTIID